MPNWCANRLEIIGPTPQIQEIKTLMTGTLYPLYQEAINLSIKMFVAGCAGILRPASETACVLFPALIEHGVGELNEASQAFSEWLVLFNEEVELTDENAKRVIAIYARTGLAASGWESLLPDQQLSIQTLRNEKRHDWKLDHTIAGEWWQLLDEKPQGVPFDMRQLIPTLLNVEINGFNGGLLPATVSAYDLYVDRYGIKWPHAYDCKLKDGTVNADQSSLQVDFDTPWSQPEHAVLMTLSERYQCSVTHYFSEEGEGFCGMSEYASGKLICSTCDYLEHGMEDEDGLSEVIGPDYIINHVPHYGG